MQHFIGDALVPLGRSGVDVSPLGFGTLPLSGDYGPMDDRSSISLIGNALDSGVNFIDTSSYYGGGQVELVVGRAIRRRRHDVVIGTKFGMDRIGLGRPDEVRSSLHGSLARLKTDYVDLYYLHQIDPTTPIEDTVGAMGELVDEGLVRALGLSEVTTTTLRRAHQTFPIAAVQNEYSLIERTAELDIIPTVRELGIAFVAYSPLGRGLLSGSIRQATDVEPDDLRRARYPRFDRAHLGSNIDALQPLFHMSEQSGQTPAALALGWVLAGHNTIPIPGTRRIANVEANVDTSRSPQDPAITRWLTDHFPLDHLHGDRYSSPVMARLSEAP